MAAQQTYIELIVWGGEFGRTPIGQGEDGRDYNSPGFSMWMAGEEIHRALLAKDFSPARLVGYATQMRQAVENMRKLVYEFYAPNFSFKDVVMKYSDAAGEITDCLSGDVNKDFTRLWDRIREFVPLPDDLTMR